MRTHANVVIVGAGIVGCSAAYHLSKLGWRDIVVVDQGPLFETGGSTSHAPGLIFQTNSSRLMTEMAKYTVGLLGDLTYEGEPCFYPVGGIEVAYTEERLTDLMRRQGWATSYGLETHLITPREVKDHIPILNDKVIKGGYYVPSDGDTRGWQAAGSLAEKAIASGAAEFNGKVRVTGIETRNGHVSAVNTDQGRITCDYLLLCTNIWGPVLADPLGIRLPLMAVEHQYLITEPLAELAGETRFIAHPILRHQDYAMYFRQHADAYGIGSYKHDPLLVDPHDIGMTAMRPFTPGDFDTAERAAAELLPPLKGKPYATQFNGMFTFTIDGFPIMGESHVRGLWTAIGIWVTHSGGAGKTIAEWMTHGHTEWDTREANINRFHSHQASPPYIHARCAQQYREVYDIIHPLQQMESPRNLRLASFHSRLVEQGGHFFESAGWEVAQWYEANRSLAENYEGQIPARQGWEARNWSPIQGAEHLAVREHAGLFNLSGFTRIMVAGPGALALLQRLTANDIDRPLGTVVYTAMLNNAGGIKADVTVTRHSTDRFVILTGASNGQQDLAWIRGHAPQDGSVFVFDMTSESAGIGLWGPAARDILASTTSSDISNAAFPYFTSKSLYVGTVPVIALRLSYAGELGWELYCASEKGQHLWDVLWESGQPYGLIAAGNGAFNSLRLEKGYRAWGSDIHTEYTPDEAGLGWAVRLEQGDFIGRDALIRSREQGVARRLCCMTLDDPEAVVLGKEPIRVDQEVVGYVTSADYGYSVGKHIVYGYLPVRYASVGQSVTITYFDQNHLATVVEDPLFDPGMTRLKG